MINMLNEDFVETKVISYVAQRGNINDETEIHPFTVSVAYEFHGTRIIVLFSNGIVLTDFSRRMASH